MVTSVKPTGKYDLKRDKFSNQFLQFYFLAFCFFFLILSATRKMPQLSFAKANKKNDVCDYDPLHPDIRMDIPLNVPYTFPKGLTRRGF